MKTYLTPPGRKLPLLFAVLLAILISCQDEGEEAPQITSEIKINSKTFPLKEGFISEGISITDVNSKSGNYYRITMTGSGLTRNTTMAGLWFTGSGCQLAIDLYSSGSMFPSDGTYSTSNFANDNVVVGSARFVFIEDLSVMGGVQYHGESGTITLKKSGNKTTLEWTMQTSENINFTSVPASGTFQGILTGY